MEKKKYNNTLFFIFIFHLNLKNIPAFSFLFIYINITIIYCYIYSYSYCLLNSMYLLFKLFKGLLMELYLRSLILES